MQFALFPKPFLKGRQLGHVSVLQNTVSLAPVESQGKPSGSGFGLLHSRNRDLIPPPQETEHSENDVHGLQPPFTI